MYILATTAVKIIALVSILAVGGGVSYYYFSSSDLSTITEREAEWLHGKEEHHHHHECTHDEYVKTIKLHVPEQLPSPKEATLAHEQKLLKEHKAGNWAPIRVMADYSNLQVSAQYSNFIKTKLVPAALGFVEAAYKVYPKSMIDEIKGQSTCGGFNIPSSQRTSGVQGYDLVLYVGAQQDSGNNWLARAGPCLLDRYTFRPVAGTVEFNTYYLSKVDLSDPSNTNWYEWIQTTIHEMTHVLAFSSSLFQYYVNPSTNQRLGQSTVAQNSQGRSWVILPNVVSRVKSFYNCQTAFGAPLENNGGQGTAGSHWERTTFGNEAMTGSDFPDSAFSQFTFSLLEGSGWYLPNYAEAQPFVWGENEGCGIAQGACPTTDDEFCSRGGQGCSVDYMGIGSCSFNDFLAPGCGYWQEFSNTDCRAHSSLTDQIAKYTGGYIGGGSRCWVTTLPKAVGYQTLFSACYKSQCINNGKAVSVTVGSKSYTCTQDNQVINIKFGYYSGTITCPEISRFCAYENLCPSDCNGVGTCRDTVCQCWAGFGGADCSQQTGR